jgi:phosphoserine aminotransferase
MSSSTVLYDTANKHNTEFIFNVTAMLFYSAHKNTALQKLNSFQIYYSTIHNTEIVMATLHVTELCYSDNVKNAENNTPTTAIYLYDLVFKHCKSFGCYVTGSAI